MKSFLRQLLLLFVIGAYIGNPVQAQSLLRASERHDTLPTGLVVTLYRGVSEQAGRMPWYYVPLRLRLSENNDQSEFSLLTYDENGDKLTDGAILHFLLVWGLDRQQTEAIEARLVATDSLFRLYGAVSVEPTAENSFSIQGSGELAEILRRSLRSISGPPIFPGGKLAASFQCSGADADKLSQLFQDHEKLREVYIRLQYQYRLRDRSGWLFQTLILEKDLAALFAPALKTYKK